MLEDIRNAARTVYYEKIKGECIFCRIAEGKSDAKKVYEDERIVAFAPLKKGSLAPGHLIVIPREHHDHIFDMSREEAGEFFGSVKEVVGKLEDTGYDGVNILNANGKAAQQSIGHMHVHLVPREDDDGYDLWPESGYSEENFSETYEELEERF